MNTPHTSWHPIFSTEPVQLDRLDPPACPNCSDRSPELSMVRRRPGQVVREWRCSVNPDHSWSETRRL